MLVSQKVYIPMAIPVEDESASFVLSVAHIPQEEVSIGLIETIVGIKQCLVKAYSLFIAGSGVVRISTEVYCWVNGGS